jgi:sigma-E factor negative regulatory protein RseC
MISETGRIVALHEGQAWVATNRRGTCGSCALRAGCGQDLVARALGAGRQHLQVAASPELALHDEVEIAIPERGLLTAALLAYLVPLLSLLSGAALGHALGGEVPAIAGALAGLAAGIGLARLLLSAGVVRLARPVLVRRLAPASR